MALSLSSSYSLSFSHSHAPALSRGVNARHSRDSRVIGVWGQLSGWGHWVVKILNMALRLLPVGVGSETLGSDPRPVPGPEGTNVV